MFICVKTFEDVEKTRLQYHANPTINSIHRASLLVPEIPDTSAKISFLNHFLLKRNYSDVACKITPVSTIGEKMDSFFYTIDKPIVYTIQLTGLVEDPVSNYIVEFFSAKNLFIPFPAVMINHVGKDFINQVHAFNRVLNDVFEDDQINKIQVKEASVDLIIDEGIDTFLLFTCGPIRCQSVIEIEIISEERNFLKIIEVDVPRFGTRLFKIKDIFTDMPNGIKGVLRVKQPKQFLFYGRMLTGQISSSGQFSANHSYYDSSETSEYWKNSAPSQRFYPFFPLLRNEICMYPIMSPSNLLLSIGIYDYSGRLIHEKFIGDLASPNNRFLCVNINSIISEIKINPQDVSNFSVIVNGDKMPTRVSHQLVYGGQLLNSSINISLHNSNVFVSNNKKSFKWGQGIVGLGYDTLVGIIADGCENSDILEHEVKISFFDDDGLIKINKINIKNNSCYKISLIQELNYESKQTIPKFVWITAESEKHGINFFAVSFNKGLSYCSGDHGF